MHTRYPWLLLGGMLLLLCGLAAAADVAPEAERIYALLGQDRGQEALLAAREWSLAHPEQVAPLLLLARLQDGTGDYVGALEALEGVYFLTHDPRMRLLQAQVYLDSGQVAEARRVCQELLREHEDFAPAHGILAETFLAKRSYQDAAMAAKVALSIDPKCAQALLAVARLALSDSKPAEAEKTLRLAVAAHPEEAEPYLWLGQALAQLERWPEAREAWRQYTRLDPASAASWLLRHRLLAINPQPYLAAGYLVAFSPDGRQVAFRSRADGTAVFIGPAAQPDKAVQVVKAKGSVSSLEWSPDSKWLAVRDWGEEQIDGKPQGRIHLWVIGAQVGSTLQPLRTEQYVGSLCWSSDSQKLVYDTYLKGKGRVIVQQSLQGGEPEVFLSSTRDESLMGCLWPAAGPLLLQRWHSLSREYQLVRVDLADRDKDQILLRSTAAPTSLTISPDGRYLVWQQRQPQGAYTPLIRTLDGTDAGRPLLRRTTPWSPISFTPDMRHLVSFQDGELAMFDLVGLE